MNGSRINWRRWAAGTGAFFVTAATLGKPSAAGDAAAVVCLAVGFVWPGHRVAKVLIDDLFGR